MQKKKKYKEPIKKPVKGRSRPQKKPHPQLPPAAPVLPTSADAPVPCWVLHDLSAAGAGARGDEGAAGGHGEGGSQAEGDAGVALWEMWCGTSASWNLALRVVPRLTCTLLGLCQPVTRSTSAAACNAMDSSSTLLASQLSGRGTPSTARSAPTYLLLQLSPLRCLPPLQDKAQKERQPPQHFYTSISVWCLVSACPAAGQGAEGGGHGPPRQGLGRCGRRGGGRQPAPGGGELGAFGCGAAWGMGDSGRKWRASGAMGACCAGVQVVLRRP